MILSGLGPVLLIFPSRVLQRKKLLINRGYLLIIVLAFVLLLYICIAGQEFVSVPTLGDLLLLPTIFFLLMMDYDCKKELLKYVVISFTVMVFPSVVYYLLELVGVNLSYQTLQSSHPGKALAGTHYLHYPLGLIISDGFSGIHRLCGLFDEPGFVGTIGAILFAAGYKKVDNKWRYILLGEIIFTLSMAGYILVLLYGLFRLYKRGFIKLSIGLLIVFLLFSFLINFQTSNPGIKEMQSRIDLSTLFLVKDNRTTSSFEAEFNRFVSSGGLALWLGNGKNAYSHNSNMMSSFSYKCLLYDFGIIGFCLYIGFFVVSGLCTKNIKENFGFFLVFVFSIYQRPYVFSLVFVTIFLLGMLVVPQKEKKQRA